MRGREGTAIFFHFLAFLFCIVLLSATWTNGLFEVYIYEFYISPDEYPNTLSWLPPTRHLEPLGYKYRAYLNIICGAVESYEGKGSDLLLHDCLPMPSGGYKFNLSDAVARDSDGTTLWNRTGEPTWEKKSQQVGRGRDGMISFRGPFVLFILGFAAMIASALVLIARFIIKRNSYQDELKERRWLKGVETGLKGLGLMFLGGSAGWQQGLTQNFNEYQYGNGNGQAFQGLLWTAVLSMILVLGFGLHDLLSEKRRSTGAPLRS